jgi:hypothetical protein
MRTGYRREDFVEGCEHRGDAHGAFFGRQWCGKRDEPHGRHELQHARKHGAEEAVEVVRDHEGGTSSGGWFRAAEDSLFGGRRVWTHRVENGGGATKLAGGRTLQQTVASVTRSGRASETQSASAEPGSPRPRQAP